MGPSGLRWARALAAIFVLWISGCVAVPEQELTNYREAYVAAQGAGEILYGEVAAVIARNAGASAEGCPTVNGIFRCFNPRTAISGGSADEDPSIAARRLALEVIATYNLAIVDLAEGKTSEALQSRIGELQGLVGDLLTLATVSSSGLAGLMSQPVLASFKALAGRLEAMRGTATARRSILAERDTVIELIDLLIADTPRMYALYSLGQNIIAIEIAAKFGRNSAEAVAERQKIAAFHASLTAYVKLLDKTKDSLNRLADAIASGGTSLSDLRAVVREATEMRNSADAFWVAVRELR